MLWNNKVINLEQELSKQVSESSVTFKCEGILTRTQVRYKDKVDVMNAILGETYRDFFERCLTVKLLEYVKCRDWLPKPLLFQTFCFLTV